MKNPHTEKMKRLAAWYDAWGEDLFRFAFYRLASREDAEDVVQEAFLQIGSRIFEIQQPRAYLYRAVQNGCSDLLRKKKKLTPLDPGRSQSPEVERFEAEEEAQRINLLLDKLPNEQAEVIRLHLYGNLHFTEIGEVLTTPPSTLKSRFSAGIERLKKMLNQ